MAEKTVREKPEPIEWQSLEGYPQGELRGKVKICGDIISPVMSADTWNKKLAAVAERGRKPVPTLDEALGLLDSDKPAPSDAKADVLLDERRMRKYGVRAGR